jgi:hypothetical protein
VTAARRLAGLALSWYPPSFRERYGAEVAGLLEDTETTARTVADLLVGALRAWTRAVVPADGPDRARRRVQASVATTWVAWCAGFLVTPAINRALLDPEPSRVPHGVLPLLNGALAAVTVSAALIVIAAVSLLGTFVAAARRDGRVARPLWVPALACAVEGAGAAGIVLWRRTYPPIAQNPHFSPWFVGALTLWALGFVVTFVLVGLGPAVATTRAVPPIAALRLPAVLAVPVAALLAVATGMSAAAVVLMLRTAHQGVSPVALAFTAFVLLIAAGASGVAVTSSVRGLRPALAGR